MLSNHFPLGFEKQILEYAACFLRKHDMPRVLLRESIYSENDNLFLNQNPVTNK